MERCKRWLHIFPVRKVLLLIVTIVIGDYVSLSNAEHAELIGKEEVHNSKIEEYIVLIKKRDTVVAKLLKKIPVTGYVVERNGYDIVCKPEKEAKTYGMEPGDRVGGNLYFIYFLSRPSEEVTWSRPDEIKIKVEVSRKGKYVVAAQEKTYKRENRKLRYQPKEKHQSQIDDIFASFDNAMQRMSERWIDKNDAILGDPFGQGKMQLNRHSGSSPGAENHTFDGARYDVSYARHITFFGTYMVDERPITKSWFKVEGERTVQLGKELLQRAMDLRDGLTECCFDILNNRRNTKMRIISDAFTIRIIIEGPPLPSTMKGVRGQLTADCYRPNYTQGHYEDWSRDHPQAATSSQRRINNHLDVRSSKNRIQIHSQQSDGDHQTRRSHDNPDNRQSYSETEYARTEINKLPLIRHHKQYSQNDDARTNDVSRLSYHSPVDQDCSENNVSRKEYDCHGLYQTLQQRLYASENDDATTKYPDCSRDRPDFSSYSTRLNHGYNSETNNSHSTYADHKSCSKLFSAHRHDSAVKADSETDKSSSKFADHHASFSKDYSAHQHHSKLKLDSGPEHIRNDGGTADMMNNHQTKDAPISNDYYRHRPLNSTASDKHQRFRIEDPRKKVSSYSKYPKVIPLERQKHHPYYNV